MICPQCSANNPDDAFFCGECGAQLHSLMTPPSGPVDISGEIDIDPLLQEPAIAETGTAGGSEPPPLEPVTEPVDEPGKIEVPSVSQPAPGVSIPPPDPLAPGAGIAPPPQAAPVQQPGAGVPPPPVPGMAAAPTGQPPAPPRYSGYPQAPGYGYAMPPDGNTSGMGQGYPAPPEASGWTFAGCIPFGLFAFLNGSVLWGLVAIPGSWIPYIGAIAGLAYFIYIGVQGRELAWRSRRFESIQQYTETMHAWHVWGIILLIVNISLVVVGIIFYAVFFAYIFAMAG